MKRKFILFFSFVFLLIVPACNQQHADNWSILEIIDKENQLSSAMLTELCKNNQIDSLSLYKWESHWILYSKLNDIEVLKTQIEKKYPDIILKIYDKPFYNFDRQKYCKDEPAKEWAHTIMTASLVEDTTLQNEYMEYHRTQFENWPEVSNGFCNADFQQVLVFRNGRQLMLIISIPKGESLDKLNRKTTENNPRVDEWNAIMSKYQEGIEEAPKGTTWVMFEPLH